MVRLFRVGLRTKRPLFLVLGSIVLPVVANDWELAEQIGLMKAREERTDE
jgi:hypothetical protein